MKRLISVLLVSFCVLAFGGIGYCSKNRCPEQRSSAVCLGGYSSRHEGTARNRVFSGTEAEEFGSEVLGVLPGFPDRDSRHHCQIVWFEMSISTGVFAGMSGSPVFIDGKS